MESSEIWTAVFTGIGVGAAEATIGFGKLAWKRISRFGFSKTGNFLKKVISGDRED